jgi:hypothetical protein
VVKVTLSLTGPTLLVGWKMVGESIEEFVLRHSEDVSLRALIESGVVTFSAEQIEDHGIDLSNAAL